MPATTPNSGAGYRPPAFALYEARFPDPGGDVVRWIHGWNGLVGAPATDVTLGARAPAGHALVTSASWASESVARIAALMAANGLDQPPMFSSASRLVEAALSESEWAPGTPVVDDRPVAVTTRALSTATVAYASGFAAAWRSEIAIRRVLRGQTRRYAADPFEPHPLDELAAQRADATP